MKIRKSDTVQILLGKDQGKSGKIARIDQKNSKVWIEGLNIYKRHVRSQQGVQGGIIDLIKPVDISNVALICPQCKKPTRVGFRAEGSSKMRVCRRCQEVI